MTRNLTRFWVPYASACAIWVLIGAWTVGQQYAHRAMSAAAQIALRGGQCTGKAGACDSTNSCTSDGDDTSCDGNTCAAPNLPCNAYQINGTSKPVCALNANSPTYCATSTNKVKCYDFLNCTCNDDLECTGTTTPEKIGICLQGMKGT